MVSSEGILHIKTTWKIFFFFLIPVQRSLEENQNPTTRPAMARGQKLLLPGTLLPVKNTFITEAETINAGTRDIAQVGKHTEKQGRDVHPERKGYRHPLVRRSPIRRRLSHLYTSVLPHLCLPSGQLFGFFLHTWPTLGPCPWCPHNPQPIWISKWRLLGEAILFIPTFDPPTRSLSANV